MKNRSRIFFATALALISSATLRAQSQLLTNPANLSQFPSVERIKTGTKGTDEVDSHARFIAALYRINSMIIQDLVQAPNGGFFTVPPAADTVHRRYSNAITRLSIDEPPPASRDPRFRTLEDKYEKNNFFDNLLTQFFSPKFRTDYYAWIRKPVPQQISGTGGAAAKPPSTDPSIVKAKAFKMDTTVFGMELGKPLSLPTCKASLFSPANDSTCAVDPNAGTGSALFDQFLGIPELMQMKSEGKKDSLSQQVIIRLDAERCPSWIFPCEATAILYDGQLVGVMVSTPGRKVENSVNAELRAKYGPPNLISNGKITPDVGNAFEVKEPLCLGRGIRVEYQVVVHNEDVGVDTSFGWVRIITETAYDRLFNKPVKRKL